MGGKVGIQHVFCATKRSAWWDKLACIFRTLNEVPKTPTMLSALLVKRPQCYPQLSLPAGVGDGRRRGRRTSTGSGRISRANESLNTSTYTELNTVLTVLKLFIDVRKTVYFLNSEPILLIPKNNCLKFASSVV